jgi:hypothetical protein
MSTPDKSSLLSIVRVRRSMWPFEVVLVEACKCTGEALTSISSYRKHNLDQSDDRLAHERAPHFYVTELILDEVHTSALMKISPNLSILSRSIANTKV